MTKTLETSSLPVTLKRGAEYIFSYDDVQMLYQLAAKKLNIKLERKMSISSVSQRMTPLEREMQGIAGEFAAARMLEISDPDKSNLASLVDYDFVYSGISIDVKTSQYSYPSLFVGKYCLERKKEIADVYFLIKQDTKSKYIFIGCATRDELFQKQNLGKLRHNGPDVYYLRSHKLKDFVCG